MPKSISKDLQIEGLEVPRAVQDEILWKVDFKASNFSYIASWTLQELERITRYAENVKLPTEDELKKFFTTLTYLRVQISNGERLPKEHKPTYLKRVFVPARFAVVLAMIGEVYYPNVAVRILPSTSIKEEDIYNREELINISDLLAKYFEDGFVGVMGISLDRYGDPHFMNKVAIIEKKPQDCIKSMTKDNPLYGFLSWIMDAELLDTVFEEAKYLMRVNYSSATTYRAIGRRVWSKVQNDSTGKNSEDLPNEGISDLEDTV